MARNDSEPADQALVRRVLRGDEEAFEQLFANEFPPLYRFVLARTGDEGAAEEVAQSTLCQAMRRLSTWRGEASLRTWVFTIGRHEIGRWLAANSEHRRAISLSIDSPDARALLESLAAEVASPEAGLLRDEVAALVRAALDLLPGRYGDVLTWKYLDDVSVGEIAVRLGLTEKAAESMLGRARAAFREAFGEFSAPLTARGGRWARV